MKLVCPEWLGAGALFDVLLREDTQKSVFFSGRTTKGVGRPLTTKQKTTFFF